MNGIRIDSENLSAVDPDHLADGIHSKSPALPLPDRSMDIRVAPKEHRDFRTDSELFRDLSEVVPEVVHPGDHQGYHPVHHQADSYRHHLDQNTAVPPRLDLAQKPYHHPSVVRSLEVDPLDPLELLQQESQRASQRLSSLPQKLSYSNDLSKTVHDEETVVTQT